MEIAIKGHSGCQVEIMETEERLLICKKTTDPAYIDRLEKQGRKQQLFAEEKETIIKVPPVLNIRSSDTECSILMEYVYALNFIDFFERAGIKQILSTCEVLERFIAWEIDHSPTRMIPTRIINEKFQDVKYKIHQNPFITHNEKIKKLLALSAPFFEQEASIEIPIGKCHGDLTFSNILFDGGSNYLIDFLDSFIETPLMDIVKLRQDTRHFWSEQMFTGRYDSLRLHMIFDRIDQRITRIASAYEWYEKVYPLFQLLNFWRILQYAIHPSVISYLENVLSDLVTDITKNSYYKKRI